MRLIQSFFVLGAVIFGLQAHGAVTKGEPLKLDVQSSGQISTSQGGVNETIKEDENHKITDLELRAQSGSRSKYSMKFIFGYSGPQLTRLDQEVQPNPNNSPGRNLTNISGSIGLRYRMTASETLNLSTGVRAYTPFSGLSEEEFNDPRLSYDNAFRWGSIEGRSSLWTAYTTTVNYRDRGQVAATGVSQTFKYKPGATAWTFGTDLSATLYHFDRDFRDSDGKVSNYYLNLIPSVEYLLRDGLNINTSIAFPLANLRRSGNWSDLDPQLASQRIGLGWAITREIYFNPYIGFYPQEPSLDNASLSFTTVFSIF